MQIKIPPADVRYRVVSQNHSEADYLRNGRLGTEEVLNTLRRAGIDLTKLQSVLDFGCGCARILQHLVDHVGAARLYGCDIDAIGIEWSKANVDYAEFYTNVPMPPLKYEAGSFDFIYALSVFSHLNEEMQRAWFYEMDRILAPGGLFYFSFSGPFVVDSYEKDHPPDKTAEYKMRGFTFVENIGDKVLPDWYQTSLQNIDFLKTQFPASFELIEHVERGHTNFQDRVLIRKRAPVVG